MKTPTHQATFGTLRDVIAWQFSHSSAAPWWVSRMFHSNVGDHWTALNKKNYKLAVAHKGDWAVWILGEGVVFVLTDAEFQAHFRPIPPVPATKR